MPGQGGAGGHPPEREREPEGRTRGDGSSRPGRGRAKAGPVGAEPGGREEPGAGPGAGAVGREDPWESCILAPEGSQAPDREQMVVSTRGELLMNT